MRVLHFADLHIGVETYSHPVTQSDLDSLPASFAPGVDRRQTYIGLPTRLLDALRAFDELVDAALSDPPVDLVLFSGDAYRSRDPSQTHQREFARRIARLTEAGIPVFLLTGNHDLPNAQGRATALEIFDTLAVRNVTVASRVGVYRIETPGGPIQIAALPWLRRSALLAQEDTKGMDFEQLRQYTENFLSDAVRRMAQELDPAIPALLAGHATVSTARLGSERSLMIGHDYTLLPSVLQDPRFDYVALGHVHHHQVLAEHPAVVYAGSLHRVDFAEENDRKGYCLLEIDSTKPQGQRLIDWRFQEVWTRPFLSLSTTIQPNDLDPTATVLSDLAKKQPADAIVRVDVRVPAGMEGQIDTGQIRRALAEAHHVAGINVRVEDESEPRTRLERGMAVERLTPLEALELYLDDRKIEPSRRATLLQYATALVSDTLGGVSSVTKELDNPDHVSVRVAQADDIYMAFDVRRSVFVEEQGVDPKLEWDGQDDDAVHVIAVLGERVVGTGRFLPSQGDSQARIGRMAVLPEYRRQGLGAQVLEILEAEARKLGMTQVLLHAQVQVKDFYASHGYRETGEPFEEAGIQHVEMRKDLNRLI